MQVVGKYEIRIQSERALKSALVRSDYRETLRCRIIQGIDKSGRCCLEVTALRHNCGICRDRGNVAFGHILKAKEISWFSFGECVAYQQSVNLSEPSSIRI